MPSETTSRRRLQAVLRVIGAVATTFGAVGAARGGAGVAGGGPVSPNVDSELRFFASWYAVLGVLVLRASRDPEANGEVVTACGAGFLLAALGRLLSWKSLGPPSTIFRLLTVVEVAIAAVVLPWQRRLTRAARARPLTRPAAQ